MPEAISTPRKAQTPKRKLSPAATTPTGRQRKLTTTMYNSPELRGRWEFSDGSQQDTEGVAPDLISGIGLLIPREISTTDADISTNASGEAEEVTARDDIVPGVSAQDIRAGPNALDNEPPTDMLDRMNLGDDRNSIQPRDILRLNFRQRAQTVSGSVDRQSPRRRRVRSLNRIKTSSPTRQLKITDLISSQQGVPDEQM